MQVKDVSTLLFRCSSLGHLMTEGRGKTNAEKYEDACIQLGKLQGQYQNAKPGLKTTEKLAEKIATLTLQAAELEKNLGNEDLPDGAKTHCIDKFTSWYYSRREDAYGKALDKGTKVEEDSITLVSLLDRKPYWKNEEWFSNEFISGTPDLLIKVGDRIDEVDDVKSSYDIFTFMRSKNKELTAMYYWQLQGYFALTGAKKGRIRFCLVNAPADAIDAEKRTLWYRMAPKEGINDPAYIEKCIQIERNMIYDMGLFRKQNPDYALLTDLESWNYDIPAVQRLHSFEVERDDAAIQSIYQRVIKAREFIKTLMP